MILTNKSNRSLALLTTLINGGSSAAAPLIQSTIAQLGNGREYKSVNIFLLPAVAGVNIAEISTPEQARNDYDVNAAGTLRQKYCVQRNNSMCQGQFDAGPVLLIFLQPVSEMSFGVRLPNALAVDLTNVPDAQFAHVVDEVEQVMNVPKGYAWGDQLLPLSPTDTTVASFMDHLQNTLSQIPGAKAFLDLHNLAP